MTVWVVSTNRTRDRAVRGIARPPLVVLVPPLTRVRRVEPGRRGRTGRVPSGIALVESGLDRIHVLVVQGLVALASFGDRASAAGAVLVHLPGAFDLGVIV